MNTYLCKKINSKLSLNRAKYISRIYNINYNNDITKTDKYNQIEILSWANKLNYNFSTCERLIKNTILFYLRNENIKILPKSFSLLVNLERLFLDGNKIVNFSILSTLPNLKRLHINSFDDISELKKTLINCEFIYRD